jgi:SNF2 family DNA or RNA helicase
MYVTQDTLHVVVPWRADLQQVIPHARSFVYNNERMLLVPNRHEEAKVARNLGVPIPAPILTRYDWRGGTPWDTQKTTSAMLTESPRAYVLNEFGTGKTRSVIWAADYLRRNQAIGKVLIAAPLSTLTPVWETELFRVIPNARVKVLHGNKETRLERLNTDADWFIINHHGLALIKDELIKRGFDVVVFDELATFRNRSTQLWKTANEIIQGGPAYANNPKPKYVWGLTGSPTPKAPTDAWGQVRLLTPERTTKSLTRFRDLTMRQITSFKWIKRPGAMDIVQEAMQPSVRFALSDVVELPDTTYQTRVVELESEARRAYKIMFDKMRVLTNNGETITAVNEGVLQSKLLQLALGYIYTDKRGVMKLPNATRLEVVKEIVEATSRKVICFVPFIHALEGVAEYLQKYTTVAVVHGQTPVGARNKIFRSFMEQSEPHTIVAHPGCMSHGLTLTAANTIVWVGPTNSYETYEQANARIVRPGQVSKTLIVHVVATPVEKLAYKRLQERGTFQGMLLELFRQQELEF